MHKRMNEKQIKLLCILGIIAGVIFQFIGITLGPGELRMVSGVCIAFAALAPLCINKLYCMSREKEFPEVVRQEEIELRDERNTQIRNRAKAKTSDFIRWIIIGLSYLNFLLKGPLWMTLALLGVFILIYLMDWRYMDKYQREM